MTRLNTQKILEENQSQYPASITSLKLNHKALSDVSCLSEFKNLETLDLSFNNLSSLQDLNSCVNLKWLSVSQNKLQNLQGIENLTKLTVLNASRNKLKSMNEIRSLISLRALILNDNQISTICKLDPLKELNTIVLSRNPISDIGDSLAMLKSITKLSLSNCQLQAIGSSLSSLSCLKEFRLTHNDITTLPAELAQNIRLQILDLGNNSISRFADLKVLSSLHNLRNLNLHGNPVAGKEEIAKKIKKLVPNLQIFNSRPIERSKKNENSEKASEGDVMKEIADFKEKELKGKGQNNNQKVLGKRSFIHKEDNPFDKVESLEAERKVEHKTSTAHMKGRKDAFSGSEDNTNRQKTIKLQKNTKAAEERKFDPIGDGAQLTELVLNGDRKVEKGSGKKMDEAALTLSKKKRKASKVQGSGDSTFKFSSPDIEVGMGGPSMWDD